MLKWNNISIAFTRVIPGILYFMLFFRNIFLIVYDYIISITLLHALLQILRLHDYYSYFRTAFNSLLQQFSFLVHLCQERLMKQLLLETNQPKRHSMLILLTVFLAPNQRHHSVILHKSQYIGYIFFWQYLLNNLSTKETFYPPVATVNVPLNCT